MAAQVGAREGTIHLNEDDVAYLMNLLRNASQPVTTQELIDALRRQSGGSQPGPEVERVIHSVLSAAACSRRATTSVCLRRSQRTTGGSKGDSPRWSCNERRPTLELFGNKREQSFAATLLNLLLARGMFMSANAPIRVPVASLAAHLEGQGEKDAADRIVAAAGANPAVFALEEIDGGRFLVTTRHGKAPVRRGAGRAALVCCSVPYPAAETRSAGGSKGATPASGTGGRRAGWHGVARR